MFLYANQKPQTKKDKLLFEIDQMAYYSSNALVKQKLKIVKEKIEELI